MRRLISKWTQRQDTPDTGRISWKSYVSFFAATFLTFCAGALYLKADQVKTELTAFSIQQGFSLKSCLLYTSPSPRDQRGSRMPSSA